MTGTSCISFSFLLCGPLADLCQNIVQLADRTAVWQVQNGSLISNNFYTSITVESNFCRESIAGAYQHEVRM